MEFSSEERIEFYKNIVNVKVSFKIDIPLDFEKLYSSLLVKHLNKLLVKKIRNMIIVKNGSESYILMCSKNHSYPPYSYHCNITGIKDIPSISNVNEKVQKIFIENSSIKNTEIQIDNITSKYEFGQNIDLRHIYSSLKEEDLISNKKLNLHTFPSLKLKFNNFGTANLYRSGKVLFLGQKSISETLMVKCILFSILNKIET